MTGPSWPPPGTPPPPRPPAGPGYRSPVLLARVVVVAMAIGLCVAAIATIAVLDQMELASGELADQARSQPTGWPRSTLGEPHSAELSN